MKDNLNNPVTIKEIEFINFKLPQKQFPSSVGFTREFYQYLKNN